MKKLFFLMVFLIFITLPSDVKATTLSTNDSIPISNIYTEGFYRFDNTTKLDMIIMLNDDVPTKIIIFDDQLNIKLLSELPYKQKFTIRNFPPDQLVGIVGEGNVAILFENTSK